MPQCDLFSPGGKGKMIAFAGDKDDAAPGAACARWKAEVHRGADAYHGWLYPRHIGGTVFVRPDGKSSPRLYNPELAKRLDQRIDQWFQEALR
jgi:dienelactone hydrolase